MLYGIVLFLVAVRQHQELELLHLLTLTGFFPRIIEKPSFIKWAQYYDHRVHHFSLSELQSPWNKRERERAVISRAAMAGD